MNETRLVTRYLVIALLVVGGLEWLLGRTVSRLSAAPMLAGTPRDIIEVTGRIGLQLVSPALLLALALLVLAVASLARRAARTRSPEETALAFILAIDGAVVLMHTFAPTQTWLNLAFNLLMWLTVLWLALRYVFGPERSIALKAGVLLVALAYSGWYIYALLEIAASAGPGSSDAGVAMLGLGELIVVFVPFAFFAAVARDGEWRHGRRWIAPIVLALVFAAGNLADTFTNMGFTGVFTTWSLGINLAWPWPLYAVALTLYVYTVMTLFSKEGGRDTGAGLILLVLAGYNLQTPYQHVLAVLGLLLLTGVLRPFAAEESSVRTTQLPVPDGGESSPGMQISRR